MSENQDIYIFGRDFHQKYFTARPMTAQQKADYDAKAKIERAKKIIEQYDELVEFAEDLEKTGIAPEFLTRLNAALGKLNRFKVAYELGMDAASSSLQAW